jgi:hemerythrin
MPIAWNDNYLLGIEVLDEQHKELVDLINSLFDLSKKNASDYVISGILKDLENKLNRHFRKEENLFERSQWKGLKDHKAAHDRFLEDFQEIKKLFLQKMPALIILVKLDKIFVDAFANHIRVEDKKYVQWVKDKLIFIS